MKITDTEVLVASPSRNFVTIRIHTDAGIYGIGDGTLNGRELAVAAYLEDHVLPTLTDKDPFDIEDLWHYLYRGGYWRNGPVTMTAIAAVDMALWDIKGKALHTPVYNLLGGKSRKKILVYTHANGKNISQTIDEANKYRELGYRAIRAQCGIPGLSGVYGVAEGEGSYEPASKGTPDEGVWDTEKYLLHIPGLFERLRDEFGDEIKLLHDAHHRLTPTETVRLAHSLEPYNLFWLEDPVTPGYQEGYRQIRAGTHIPLAEGETLNSFNEVKLLITERLIDYLRMSVTHSGGITNLRKIAGICEQFDILMGCHGASDLSPVSMAAALHLNMAIHNFGIQEHMGYADIVHEVFPHEYSYQNGYMYPGDRPGLGVDFDEKKAAEYPYEPACLPVNRKTDGTMFNW